VPDMPMLKQLESSMDNEEHNVRNEGSRSLIYNRRRDHIKDFFLSQWTRFPIYLAGLFTGIWTLIGVIDFFYTNLNLNNIFVLFSGLLVALFFSLIRCIYIYRNTVPDGLENESSEIQKIAFSKKPYWEYAMAYELVKSRIHDIDQKLEDVISNRVHIKITRTMSEEQYADWLQTRPDNLLRIVAVSKQLLIFDLIEAMHAEEENKVDYCTFKRVAELIKDAYKSCYDFEVEGREISIPEGFGVVHELQTEWASVVRDGFHQMLEFLQSVAARSKEDRSPLDMTIFFRELPRLDEFSEELEKISHEIEIGRAIK
jgi:hypothetical protein